MSIDQFYTPPELVRSIVAKLIQYGDMLPGDRVLDPCVGKGAFARELGRACPDLKCRVSVDLDPQTEADFKVDFLCEYFTGYPGLMPFNLICSNPPFSQWQKFVARGIELLDPRGTVAYLLRFSALGPSVRQNRAEFLRQYPVSTVDICRPRPSFYGGSDNSEYALFRWCPQDFDGLRARGAIVGQVGAIDWEKPRKAVKAKAKRTRKSSTQSAIPGTESIIL